MAITLGTHPLPPTTRLQIIEHATFEHSEAIEPWTMKDAKVTLKTVRAVAKVYALATIHQDVVWPSAHTVAKAVGCSDKTVRRVNKFLFYNDYLQVDGNRWAANGQGRNGRTVFTRRWLVNYDRFIRDYESQTITAHKGTLTVNFDAPTPPSGLDTVSTKRETSSLSGEPANDNGRASTSEPPSASPSLQPCQGLRAIQSEPAAEAAARVSDEGLSTENPNSQASSQSIAPYLEQDQEVRPQVLRSEFKPLPSREAKKKFPFKIRADILNGSQNWRENQFKPGQSEPIISHRAM